MAAESAPAGDAGGAAAPQDNFFQRQIELKGWHQPVVDGIHALVLGVGGLGTTISMDLCRLGVRKITLLDYDVVDAHNLNRQILFSKQHVGKSKVASAKEVLDAAHSLRTEVVAINTDAVKRWGDVVALARGTYVPEGAPPLAPEAVDPVDVIFNSIDYGDAFDNAVSSLALALDLPVVLGGTEPWYGHTVSYFFQEQRSLEGAGPCFACAHDSDSVTPAHIASVAPDLVLGLTDISHMPKDVYPDQGGSTAYSAGTCSHLMVAAMMSFLLRKQDVAVEGAAAAAAGKPVPPYASEDASSHRMPPKNTTILNLISFEASAWRTERNPECKLCAGYHPEWEAAVPPPAAADATAPAADAKAPPAAEEQPPGSESAAAPAGSTPTA